MRIRRACAADIPEIGRLLLQVHAVHAQGRPDLFAPGGRKYQDDELARIIADDEAPVFVAEAEGEAERLAGYAFCLFEHHGALHSWQELDTLYIDDICVDEAARRGGVGRALYEHVLAFARERGCHNVTLNVWECNPGARAFYESLGMTPYKIGMEQIL